MMEAIQSFFNERLLDPRASKFKMLTTFVWQTYSIKLKFHYENSTRKELYNCQINAPNITKH